MSNNQQHNNYNAWNAQQQPVFQSQSMQPSNFVSDFPSMANEAQSQQQVGSGQNATAQQSADFNPFGNAQANTFNFKATEFVPEGVVAGQEAFPDMDEAFGGGGGKKSKKNQPTKAQIDKEALEAQQALSTKGKAPAFFVHNGSGVLSQEQMVFVFQYYPQYSMNPVSIVDWLYREAIRIETEEKQRQQAEAQTYGQPSRSNRIRNNNYQDEDDYEEVVTHEDSSFGFQASKNKKKQLKSAEPAVSKEVKKKENDAKVKIQAAEIKQKTIKDITVKVDEEKIQKVDESRQPCSLVFIGHVDAGKSTISGQIMYLMGCVDERTIEKYKKDAKDKGRDSWWLAYCMDIGDEEKAKGKTVEVGRATFNTLGKQFTVFDAPGHKNYVPNMIMGAALADYAGLVISARRGEFEAGFEKDGQTREHVQLAKSLGVQKLVVVVNKMDEPSVQWNEDRYNSIRDGLGPFLEKSGYPPQDVFYVPISGLTGANILNLVDPKECSWYKGKTLMNILDDLPVETRDANGPVRIPILDKVKDQGIVAHGKIESGTIRIGDKISISPSGYPAQVGQILDHKNESVKFARPGENVQITLVHINDEAMINKGDVISMREQVTPVTQIFEAEMDVMELLPHKPILAKGYTCVMHCHTYSEDIEIDTILSVEELNHASGKMEVNPKLKFIKQNQKCRVRISTTVPLAMEKFDVLPQLGRFTLRDEGRTIAVGKILKYKPHKVECSIQVAGGVSSVPAKSDKNEAIVFDMETGEVAKAKKALDQIAEE